MPDPGAYKPGPACPPRISPAGAGTIHPAGKTAAVDDRGFPKGFFDRADPATDAEFYVPTRLVTHID